MGTRALMAGFAWVWVAGCQVENPAWFAETQTEGGSGSASNAGTEGSTTAAPPTSGTASWSSSAATDESTTSEAMSSSVGSSSSSGGQGEGFSCSGEPTIQPLPVDAGWSAFDINPRQSDVVVSVVADARLRVFAVDPSGVTGLLDEEVGGPAVLSSLRGDELTLAIRGDDPDVAAATLYRAVLGPNSLQTLGSFSVPIFPLRGVMRGSAEGFSLLTRTQTVDSPAYLVRLDASQSPLTQTDGAPLPSGDTTWLVGREGGQGSSWLVFRLKPSNACAVLEVLPDGSVGESWEFADECFDPDVAPFKDGAVVSYHRAEADRNVYVRTFMPGRDPSIELGLGTGGAEEADAHVVTRGGEALVVWIVDEVSLGGAVVELESGGIERLPNDLAPLPDGEVTVWAFATQDGTAGAVHSGTTGVPQATFLCDPL